jgi:hypothetical protein
MLRPGFLSGLAYTLFLQILTASETGRLHCPVTQLYRREARAVLFCGCDTGIGRQHSSPTEAGRFPGAFQARLTRRGAGILAVVILFI